MRKLTPLQQRLLDAMTPGVWYDALLDGLPLASGHTYRALICRGLIVDKRTSSSRGYCPLIWTHKFMRVEKTDG